MTRSAQDTRSPLRGRSLDVARVAWLTIALLAIVTFIASIPAYYNFASAQATTPAGAHLPIRLYAGYVTGLSVSAMAVFASIAGIVFWRKSEDWMALIVSTALLTLGVAISPTLGTLAQARPGWALPVLAVRGLAAAVTLFVFYLFPDGRFEPRWTRILAIVWIGWLLAWAIFPASSGEAGEPPLLLRMILFLLSAYSGVLSALLHALRLSSLMLVLLIWFISGVLAQIYRYTRVSTPVQRQQTKWVVFGMTVGVIGFFGFHLPSLLIPALVRPGMLQIIYSAAGGTLSTLLLLLVPLSIHESMLRHELWRIDPIIHRTLLYGTLTGTLAVIYLGTVFVFQLVFRALTGQQSDLAIVISTLASAALFQPLRSRLQNFVDRRFYREKVDFRRAFTQFSREVRTIIELPELLRVLVERTTDLLHITHGAVFLRQAPAEFLLAEVRNLHRDDLSRFAPETHAIGKLLSGSTVSRPDDTTFPLLVPLIAPRTEGSELVGVLALGPRLSGLDYSREDQALLMGLADQAGTAIYVARLIEEKQVEAERRIEIERRLEEHRNSPIGRAETFAQAVLDRPGDALTELHRLAQAAGQDPDAASVLDNLPGALDGLEAGALTRLAEGYGYLVKSQLEPEMLPVGLRILNAQLEQAADDRAVRHAAEALRAYRLCQAALDADSIAQITALMEHLKVFRQARTDTATPFDDLDRGLADLYPAAEALYACERVDTSRDRLAYLASAVERLQHVDHAARTELEGADRAVIERIAESWLAVVTGAMSDLQTRAQITCRLLTRHTWQGDVVSLALSLRNAGRGAAINLRVTLAPAPEYTLLDGVAHIERLAPGDETRVELRVRPHLAEGSDQFRARFVIVYTDPRGPDQVENFADVVHLLAMEGEFQFIPNPYVVGTPLEAGSLLFFGRDDVVAYVQENLSAHHRNNMVLIGQRRTGKTSLLKQLPARLGDDYVPVYLDGQALGLDPGMAGFFLTLATEIAFALEDRAFAVDPPEAGDFADSPAGAFERGFLPRVRAAIGHRHLLIMFDEFEELEAAVRRGNLDRSIFGFLRHLIQHIDGLSVVFCGTHRLEELAADYWSVLFNISLYRHIAFLERDEAMRLVQEPVAPYGMRYDDLALEKIWQVTAGHPYFLQLLCHSLVNHHNRSEKSYVTIADVNAALDEILASGEAHFVYLWMDGSPDERLALAVLSRMIPLTGHATPVQVIDYLVERGVSAERLAIGDALHRLALRDILIAGHDADPAGGETYRWRLGLLGLWVEKYKSLGRVIDEMRR